MFLLEFDIDLLDEKSYMAESQLVKDLREKGYTITENVLSKDEIEESLCLFHSWLKKSPQLVQLHRKISPHGIIKFGESGHQRHA